MTNTNVWFCFRHQTQKVVAKTIWLYYGCFDWFMLKLFQNFGAFLSCFVFLVVFNLLFVLKSSNSCSHLWKKHFLCHFCCCFKKKSHQKSHHADFCTSRKTFLTFVNGSTTFTSVYHFRGGSLDSKSGKWRKEGDKVWQQGSRSTSRLLTVTRKHDARHTNLCRIDERAAENHKANRGH